MRRVLFDKGRSALGAGSASRCPLIRPVHTRVRGRARFKIAQLYRSSRLKRHLECSLSGLPGIHSVEANVLTGSLLVLYAPEKSVGDITQLIAEQLVAATSSAHLTLPQAVQPVLQKGPYVFSHSGEPSSRSAISAGFTALPEAFPITPALFSVPLGFLRTFSIGLLHASPILVFLTLLIVLMGQIVGKEEGWSKADALYFSFITATTVGYGDLRPTKPLSKVLAVTIGFVGVIFTGIVTAIGLHAAQSAFARLRSAEIIP